MSGSRAVEGRQPAEPQGPIERSSGPLSIRQKMEAFGTGQGSGTLRIFVCFDIAL